MSTKSRNPTLLDVGRRFRAHREQLGLSLTQVEAKTGIKAIRLGSYERGDRVMTILSFLEMAKIYGLDPATLLPNQTGVPLVTDQDLSKALRAAADRIDAIGGAS